MKIKREEILLPHPAGRTRKGNSPPCEAMEWPLGRSLGRIHSQLVDIRSSEKTQMTPREPLIILRVASSRRAAIATLTLFRKGR